MQAPNKGGQGGRFKNAGAGGIKDVLTSGAAEQMGDLWDAAPDASVSEALAEGARVEPWRAGSQAFPPSGMRATDRDAMGRVLLQLYLATHATLDSLEEGGI